MGKIQVSFSDDFLHRARKSVPCIDADEHILNATLVDIDKRLQCHVKSLADFPGMPTPIHTKNSYDEALIIQQELDDDVASLNAEQHTLLTTTMSAVSDHKQYPKVLFIDGPGGTGKTFLYNTLMAKVRSQSKIEFPSTITSYPSVIRQFT